MKEDRYNMCGDQPAQIDCRITDCKFHEEGSCINVSPAITLNTDDKFTCWSKRFKTQDMEDTEFKTGDFCCFPYEAIKSTLILLQKNGYSAGLTVMDGHNAIKFDGTNFYSCFGDRLTNVHQEISREQFLHKATRGKVKPDVEFDPSKPFEVSHDGEQWERLNLHYIGFNELSNVHVFADLTFGPDCYVMYNHIRNISEFTASMLEVGECMECETGQDGKKNILKRISNEKWICIRHGIDTIDAFTAKQIKGRRVKVKITTEEV